MAQFSFDLHGSNIVVRFFYFLNSITKMHHTLKSSKLCFLIIQSLIYSTKLTLKWAQINKQIYTHISTDSNYCWFLDSKLQWIVFLLQETTRCFVPVAVFFTILRFKTSSFIILFLAIISKQIIAYSSLLVNFKMISNLVFIAQLRRSSFKIPL